MKYFVESVTTYNTTGKSRKGAILQKAASLFEHQIIGDHKALESLIGDFRKLVNACNEIFKGKPLKVNYNKANYILCVESAEPRADINTDVFTMQLAPVGITYYSSNVHQEMYSTVALTTEPNLLETYRKGGDR